MHRTARGKSGRGRALLMLLPEELAFLKYLKVSMRCCPPQLPPWAAPPRTPLRLAVGGTRVRRPWLLPHPADHPPTHPPAHLTHPHTFCRPQAAKVPLNEYDFPTSKLANVQSQARTLARARVCLCWSRVGV